MALGAVASFSPAGDKYNGSIAAIALGILVVNIVAGIIWLAFGTVIGRLLRSKRPGYLQRFHGVVDRSLCVTDLALRSERWRKIIITWLPLPAKGCVATQPGFACWRSRCRRSGCRRSPTRSACRKPALSGMTAT